MFEVAEIQRYTQEIKAFEMKYREIKFKEDEDERRQKDPSDSKVDDSRQQPQGKGDFLLLDNSNLDYEGMKNQYPLGSNRKDENGSSPD
jgi:hypothetical protein